MMERRVGMGERTAGKRRGRFGGGINGIFIFRESGACHGAGKNGRFYWADLIPSRFPFGKPTSPTFHI